MGGGGEIRSHFNSPAFLGSICGSHRWKQCLVIAFSMDIRPRILVGGRGIRARAIDTNNAEDDFIYGWNEQKVWHLFHFAPFERKESISRNVSLSPSSKENEIQREYWWKNAQNKVTSQYSSSFVGRKFVALSVFLLSLNICLSKMVRERGKKKCYPKQSVDFGALYGRQNAPITQVCKPPSAWTYFFFP